MEREEEEGESFVEREAGKMPGEENHSAGNNIARLKQGWLVKQGGRVKNWKRRFFVLDGTSLLAYYLSEADAQAGIHHLGIINLQKALYVTPRASSLKDTTIFWPSHVPPDACFTIITGDRNYGIYSDIGADDCKQWVDALQKVRGNVDKQDITLDDFAVAGGMRPRAATLSQVQLDTRQARLAKHYNMTDLPPKVLVVFCKWHRLLEKALDELGKSFGTSAYQFECDMGELFEKAPKLRTRLGELVFGDYVDELRYNLCKELGSDDVGKEAFVKATGEQKILFTFVDDLPDNLPNRLSLKDGTLLMEVSTKHLGNGMHLMGKDFVYQFKALSVEPVCGGVVEGLPLADALNVCRSRAALEQALSKCNRALSSGKFSFECDYREIHEAAEGTEWAEVQHHLGDTIIGNVVNELCSQLAAQAYAGKSAQMPAKLESLLSQHKIVFKLGEDDQVRAEASENGLLLVSLSLKKLHELAVYERTAMLDLKPLLGEAAKVEAGTSL